MIHTVDCEYLGIKEFAAAYLLTRGGSGVFIEKVISNCLAVLDQISPGAGEIIVVDDGSTDSTLTTARELEARHDRVRVISHGINRGIGHALRTGYAAARFENVVNVSGDGQFDTDELLLYPELEDKTVLSFTRERRPGYTLYKHLLTRTNRTLNRICLGLKVKDINWTNAYKTADLQALELSTTSLMVESEIVAKLVSGGSHVREVPSVYHRRISGTGKATSVKIVLQALRDVVPLIRSVRRHRKAVRQDRSPQK